MNKNVTLAIEKAVSNLDKIENNDLLKDINSNKPSNSSFNFFQIDLEDYSNLENI